MALALVTAPAAEPVSRAEAQTYAGIVSNASNDTLTDELIKAARRSCESFTRRVFIAQTWDMVLDDIGLDNQAGRMLSDLRKSKGMIRNPLKIPFGQLTAVGGVFVTDDNNVETTVDPTTYFVDLKSEPGRVILGLGQAWPQHRDYSGFRVRFTAGWANAAAVPEDIKVAIKRTVKFHFGQRADLVSESLGDASLNYGRGSSDGAQLPPAVKALLADQCLLDL